MCSSNDATWWNYFLFAREFEFVLGGNSGQEERMGAGTREHKCKTDDEHLRTGEPFAPKHEWQSGNTGPPFIVRPFVRSRGLSRLFLPVRGHNERFLAYFSPIVPFRNVSFISTMVVADRLTNSLARASLLGRIYFLTHSRKRYM